MNVNDLFGISQLNMQSVMVNRIAYDGNGNPEYLGLAVPGSADSDGAWMIRKIVYDGSQRPAAIKFAGGNIVFDKVWDDRATYSYS